MKRILEELVFYHACAPLCQTGLVDRDSGSKSAMGLFYYQLKPGSWGQRGEGRGLNDRTSPGTLQGKLGSDQKVRDKSEEMVIRFFSPPRFFLVSKD